jgi:transcriptional regulator with XRE-family HTH domain
MGWFDEAPEVRREVVAERLVLDAAELVCDALSARGISRADLAEKLEVPPAEVTMRLRGTRNMTLKSLARTLDALDFDVKLFAHDRASKRRASTPVGTVVFAGSSTDLVFVPPEGMANAPIAERTTFISTLNHSVSGGLGFYAGEITSRRVLTEQPTLSRQNVSLAS